MGTRMHPTHASKYGNDINHMIPINKAVLGGGGGAADPPEILKAIVFLFKHFFLLQIFQKFHPKCAPDHSIFNSENAYAASCGGGGGTLTCFSPLIL